jgi:hypothetical protein
MARAHPTSASRGTPLVLLLAACTGTPPATGTTTRDGGTTTGTTASETTTRAEASTTAAVDDGATTQGTSGGPSEPLPCNGHAALCDRRLDEVVLPGTHNAHAARDDGFPPVNANQQHDIARQLDDGIRVLLIDLYLDEADPSVVLMCHGPCGLASTPHLEGLGAIVAFLQQHPREVVAIVYEDHVDAEAIATDMATAGADALVLAHAPGSPWPTLGAMIEADTRLVVMAETSGPPPPWLHHAWDEAWDTPYGPTSVEALSCALNRGAPDNDLLLVNHWVNDALGLPSEANAAIVNASDVLQARAEECWRYWDHPPNFLVVDFYEQGDLLAVVDALNGVGP